MEKWYFFHLSCFSKTFTGDLSFSPQFLIYVSVFFFKVFILLSIIPFLLVLCTDFILLLFDCSQCSGSPSSSVIFFGHCKCLKKSSALQRHYQCHKCVQGRNQTELLLSLDLLFTQKCSYCFTRPRNFPYFVSTFYFSEVLKFCAKFQAKEISMQVWLEMQSSEKSVVLQLIYSPTGNGVELYPDQFTEML